MYLQGLMVMTQLICALVLFRKMLTKDKKPPEERGPGKELGQVIPTRPETPKLFKAALVVGKGEMFAKLKETYKDPGATLQVLALPILYTVCGGLGKSALLDVSKHESFQNIDDTFISMSPSLSLLAAQQRPPQQCPCPHPHPFTSAHPSSAQSRRMKMMKW